MFTGLIETTAEIIGRDSNGRAGKLYLRPRRAFERLIRGESIAVNGACLSLEQWTADGILEFHTLAETLSRTNLGILPPGAEVNLERALQLGERLGGHIVTGHVDATADFLGINRQGDDIEFRVALPEELRIYLAPKGSIAIDGVSLTLVDIGDESFSVRLIPLTLEETALGRHNPGDRVNLEADLLGKYVQRQLACYLDNSPNPGSGRITMETLINAGW
ncbi:MAG: riboflavin synthase [Victivallales bacterium]|nr:riboflavin synthase [Victivallales bacterium]